MDERMELLVIDYRAGRYTRRQFVRKALSFGLAATAIPVLLEMGGDQPNVEALPKAEAAGPQKTVVMALAQPTTIADPANAQTYGDIQVINNNIYEPIVRNKTGTVTLEPCLARSWDISDDGLTYTFHLRPAFFHDGTPVTADAVKLNFERQIDSKNPYNLPSFPLAEVLFDSVSKVEAVNPTTLRVTQKRPDASLLANLAAEAAGIASRAVIEKYGKDFGANASAASGSGPFKLEHWDKGVQFVQVANERYWGGRPRLDRVVWKSVEDSTVRLQQLRAGEIDVMTDVAAKDIPALKADKRFKVITGDILNVQFIVLNQTKPPLDKIEVRQAIQFAINKANISKVAFNDNYTVGGGPLMPGILGYDKSLQSVYAYDPKRAKDLLQKTGLGENVELALTHRLHAFWPEVAQLIQADLQAVGIKLTLQPVDDAAFYPRLRTSQHQLALSDWTNDTGDPSEGLAYQFASNATVARMGYKNPDVVKLISDAQLERNPSKRQDMYVRLQRMILADAYYVTLGYRKEAWAARANVQALTTSPLRDVVMRGVSLG